MKVNKKELPDWLEELRPHPLDDEYRSPNAGGCWICHQGNGWEGNPPEWGFSMEFDCFYHTKCVEKSGIDPDSETPILEFEKKEW